MGVATRAPPDGDIRRSFSRMKRAIQVASPEISVQAGVWIDKLEEMLTKALAKGVRHKPLGKFYRACMCKVSTPVMRYAGGEGRSAVPRFDMAFLLEESEARDEFKDAIYERGRARDASLDDEGPPTKKPRGDRQKKQAAAKKATAAAAAAAAAANGGGKKPLAGSAAAALKAYNAAAPRRISGVAAGATVPMPKDLKGDDFVAFRTAHPPVTVPGVGARQVCWNYCHPQGCIKQGDCSFAHPH
jgi:hypothetical protein